MDFSPFCDACIGQATEPSRMYAEIFCRGLDEIFADGVYEDSRKVILLFYGSGKTMSKTQFYRKRKFVIALYEWLAEQKVVSKQFVCNVAEMKLHDVVSEMELNTFFFKDLRSAIGYIDRVCDIVAHDSSIEPIVEKAIVVLSWNLVDTGEMRLIRKTDLNRNDNTIRIRGDRPRFIQLDKFAFDIVDKLANASYYNTFPYGGHKRTFVDSPYLFRSSNNAQLTINAIACYLQTFNTYATGGRLLSIRSFRRNGVFEQIKKIDDGKTPIIYLVERITCGSEDAAFGYAQIYKSWKKKFYKE